MNGGHGNAQPTRERYLFDFGSETLECVWGAFVRLSTLIDCIGDSLLVLMRHGEG